MSKEKLTGVALVLGVALTLGASVYYRQISTAVASLRRQTLPPAAIYHNSRPHKRQRVLRKGRGRSSTGRML